MLWAARKNAPAPTAANLRNSGENARSEIKALSDEAENIHYVLPQLVTDPGHAAKAESRLRDIEALLPTKHRTLELIESEIPKADRREQLDELEAERLKLERTTVKLMVGLPDRFERAAAQYATVLAEMGNNATQWGQLRMRADAVFGVKIAGQDAEARLRAGLVRRGAMGSAGEDWRSLHEEALVEAWDGRVLFEGAKA